VHRSGKYLQSFDTSERLVDQVYVGINLQAYALGRNTKSPFSWQKTEEFFRCS
jgi:hypothetical protein